MSAEFQTILIKFNRNNSTELRKLLEIDEIFFYYLWKEFNISRFYCRQFIKIQKSRKFKFLLLSTKTDLIDYNWNDRVITMVRERCELDHALSWLSTLGGAFSALGDYYANCAQIAGRISINQFKLALRLNDPTIQSRCRLYLSLSLIQQKRFKFAQRIIKNEFDNAKQLPNNLRDDRLIRMCYGIWSKLQYEHQLYIINRTKMKQINIE